MDLLKFARYQYSYDVIKVYFQTFSLTAFIFFFVKTVITSYRCEKGFNCL